ncbi:DUF1830 domain-containing protein [Moorena sp. SIO3H5]|uniref:DUF1830 domain-containing protein n=1 Tax=Moorena sp. SIO3H5 TaxID=2607834 RepID=UPI0013BD368F|nr:DUF1830 domain-containing protein [Moorena sp. SIO3H5]NEO69601.1 DUF1830 domain-containing protein [Moorena sp. SIO3H5]
MTQIFDPVPSDSQDSLLCCYVNATSQIQIARITNIPNWYFERVVFPGQRLVFEAPPQALVEIHTGMMASSILSDTIPCHRLLVSQNGNSYGYEVSSESAETADIKPHPETVDTQRVLTEKLPRLVSAV